MTAINPLDALKEIDALLAPGESDPERMAELLAQVAQIAAKAVADATDQEPQDGPMPKADLITYQGYKIAITTDPLGANVFDPQFKQARPIYRATSVAYAKNWIDAYRGGAQWAIDEAWS